MSRISAIIGAVLICLLVSMVWAINHYRDNAISYKEQRNKATERLSLASATINDMQTRQRDVAALDAKYTGELANAKKQLDDLQRCVSTGKCGLRINAKCPESGTTDSTGLDDVSGPRLTLAAERDYFTLRERIEITGKQIAGLQQYINEQCLR